jgi:hypothetical protein
LQLLLTQLVPPLQAIPQVPQLLLSVDGLVHVALHRFGVIPVHWQFPPRHCSPPVQGLPHAWQLPLSLCKSTHAPPQSVRLVLQASVQEVPLHAGLPSVAPLLGPGHPVVHDAPQLLAGAGFSQDPGQVSVPPGH